MIPFFKILKPGSVLILSMFMVFSLFYFTGNTNISGQNSISDDITLTNDSQNVHQNLCLPAIKSEELIVVHPGFSLSFNQKHMQANWVAYEINSENTLGKIKRTNRFKPDPNIPGGTARNADYLHSGYDKGHMAPAADMGWSLESMTSSFYFSNISPQLPGFNRGIWKNLEEQVRFWADFYGNIFLATGPVLKDSLPTIGLKNVSVPEYFYKVILDTNGGNVKGIGFIMPNSGSDKPVQHYTVTIDSVERLTGIDFFTSLPDTIEFIVESKLCTEFWIWKNEKADVKEKSKHNKPAQCKGITNAGARCKNMTFHVSGYCPHHIHQNE
jgi:endonuclease G